MLPSRDEVFISNVVSEQPPANEMTAFFYPTAVAKKQRIASVRGLYPKPNVLRGIELLKLQISIVKPDIIIGFGNYVLWALTENCFSVSHDEGYMVPRGIGQWRGSQLNIDVNGEEFKFLPTYHPAAVFQTWSWRYLIVHDLKTRIPKVSEWKEPKYDFIIRPDSTQTVRTLTELIARADASPTGFRVAVDLETRGGLIACIGIAWSRKNAITIPFICTERTDGYWSLDEEYLIVPLLRRLLTHQNVRLIGQNFLYDAQYLVNFLWLKPHIFHDTMLAHHVCWPGGGDPNKEGKKKSQGGITQKGLSHLSSLYCEHHRYWKDEGKLWEAWMGEEQLWIYNCTDCIKTFEIFEVLDDLIDELDLREQFQFQMDQANELALPMMLRGVRIDKSARTLAALELAGEIERYEKLIEAIIPEDVYPRKSKQVPWTSSSKQQMEIFYDILGIKPVKHRKTGNPTLGKEALPIIARREPIVSSIISKLGDLRRFASFHSATQMPLDSDGRMRCSFNPAGTETFRWSSSENAFGGGGNLQNISKGQEAEDDGVAIRLPNMRKFFIPDPGYEIAEFDLSGADAQVVAWEAGDEDLKAAFRAGLKLHIKNARDVYPEQTRNMGDEDLKKTDHQGGLYGRLKRMVHGTNYGGTSKGMATIIQCAVRDIEEFQERWFYLHPGIKDWHSRTEGQLARTRSVSNRFGFRVVYFDRVNGLLPQALAWVPQSTVAIACLRGALAVKRQCPWVQLLLQVHDSIAVQYPREMRSRLSEVKRILHSIVVPYDDPLTIPWGATASEKSWGDGVKVQGW